MAATPIREARIADANRLVTLALELGYDSSAESMRKSLERMIGSSEHGVFVLEHPSEGVIGCAHVTVQHTLVAKPCAEVEALVVTHSHRKGGLGKALMEACERWAAKRGVRQIVVRAQQHRQAAHRFYQSMGYEVVKEQRVFRRELEGKQELPGVPTVSD